MKAEDRDNKAKAANALNKCFGFLTKRTSVITKNLSLHDVLNTPMKDLLPIIEKQSKAFTEQDKEEVMEELDRLKAELSVELQKREREQEHSQGLKREKERRENGGQKETYTS